MLQYQTKSFVFYDFGMLLQAYFATYVSYCLFWGFLLLVSYSGGEMPRNIRQKLKTSDAKAPKNHLH